MRMEGSGLILNKEGLWLSKRIALAAERGVFYIYNKHFINPKRPSPSFFDKGVYISYYKHS